jgi:hypothetical protein
VKLVLSTLKKVLFWSYERGSWQYDLMCVLILAFIILAPNRHFESHDSERPLIVRSEEIGPIDPRDLRAIEARLQQIYGYAVRVSRIERAEDASGDTYVVWRK